MRTIDFIPVEMKNQLAERMLLLDEMIAAIGVCSAAEWFEVPALLIMQMSVGQLLSVYKSLMKTRKRFKIFYLNGRTYLVTRRQAIALVRNEMTVRGI